MLQLLILAATLAAPPASAVPPREGDTVESYIVRPGDTLEGITGKYLGDPSLWPENHRLNPQVGDPHKLRPGAEIRIITKRTPLVRTAQVVELAKKVEEKPFTLEWRPSHQGSLLREREGLRTGPASFSALQFDDGTRVSLGEESVLFVREATSTLYGRKKQSMEILAGQADLRSRVPAAASRSEIQITVGDAVLRPAVDASGQGDVRARRGSEGGAGIMVFTGQSQVEAAGVKVSVPRGMGTLVPKGEAPRTPEMLLPPPTNEWPKADESVGYGNPTFVWRKVPRAAAYTVELCADPACQQLVERATGLREPRYAFPRLEARTYYWRAMGVTGGGLDGYPSTPSRVIITNSAPDLTGPTVEPKILGFSVPKGDGTYRVVEQTRVALKASDDASGVAELRYRWNGGPWRKDRLGSVGIPLVPGPQVLEVKAIDVTGRESRIERLGVELGAMVCCSPWQVWRQSDGAVR